MVFVEYKIISGPVEEVRQMRMTANGRSLGKRRGIRVKGNSSIKKLERNEKDAILRLGRLINCNFTTGDLWLTLRYNDERLPEDRKAAKEDAKKFLRKIRDELKKQGKNLRYIITTSDTNGKTGEDARIHHHIVMDAMAWETVIKYWPEDQITYRRLDGRRDYTGAARYMVKQAPHGDNEPKWSPSRGLKKPIYTMPVLANPDKEIKVPAGSVIKEKTEYINEETGDTYRYVRYIQPPRAGRKRNEILRN